MTKPLDIYHEVVCANNQCRKTFRTKFSKQKCCDAKCSMIYRNQKRRHAYAEEKAIVAPIRKQLRKLHTEWPEPEQYPGERANRVKGLTAKYQTIESLVRTKFHCNTMQINAKQVDNYLERVTNERN